MSQQPTVALESGNAEHREMTEVAGAPSVQSAIVAYRTGLDGRRAVYQESDTERRFWANVDKSAACWVWIGGSRIRGYGMFHAERRMYRAHRVSWELTRGVIPDGMHVLHRCDNRPCVNPDHLFLGTNQDNVDDMVAKRRHPVGSRKRGAKLTEAAVSSIRARLATGATQASLAREFGVSFTVMNRVALGRTWRHLPDGSER